MRAIIYQGPQNATLVTDRPIPSLREDYILVKTVAIALNPTDWKHVEYGLGKEGCVLGVDYAGVVEEIGPKVGANLQKGDRVCGFVHGCNQDNLVDGAFAEFIVAKGDIQIRIPDSMSFEDAATLGCGIQTVGQGLYDEHRLCLSSPSKPTDHAEPVLLYGGSTATGTLGIQFLKLSGYKVITTCSPHNFDLVKSLGADQAFDYKDPDCAKKIKQATNGELMYAWDCIGQISSARICSDALSSASSAHYSTIGHARSTRKDIKYSSTLAYTSIGETFEKYGRRYEHIPAHLDFARGWVAEATKYLESGQVKAHPISLRKDGLKGALKGMAEMKQGNYSAEKLVYRIDETL